MATAEHLEELHSSSALIGKLRGAQPATAAASESSWGALLTVSVSFEPTAT